MRKPAELRKAQIVLTILDLADRIGPDRVTTGAVAAEIGVTQAAVFRHFPTKAEMWVAVADHIAGLLTTAWAEALKDTAPPIERLKALIGAQLDQITATPAMPTNTSGWPRSPKTWPCKTPTGARPCCSRWARWCSWTARPCPKRGRVGKANGVCVWRSRATSMVKSRTSLSARASRSRACAACVWAA